MNDQRMPAGGSVKTAILRRCRQNGWFFLVLAVLTAQWLFVISSASYDEIHQDRWAPLIHLPLWPAYADLRVISEAWDEVAAGRDPLRQDLAAPKYNYPRLWLFGEKLGWRSVDTPWLGAGLTAAFLLAVAVVAWRATGWTRWLVLGASLSPPIWLGLERGNTDLLIFALITPALLAGRPAGGWRTAWTMTVILLAALLKYFPIICLAVFWRGAPRWARVAMVGCAVAFAGYLAANAGEVRTVFAKTPQGGWESYGTPIAGDWLRWGAEPVWLKKLPARERGLLFGSTAFLAAAAFASGCRPLRDRLRTPALWPEAETRLFLAGMAIYVATFLLAINWSYRLVFLIWTLPLLGHWLRAWHWLETGIAAVSLGLMAVLFWTVNGRFAIDMQVGHGASVVLIFFLTLLPTALWWARPQVGAVRNVS